MKQLIVFTVIAASALAGNVEVHPGSIERDGDWLVYDNGTPEWLSWDGTYRGVWFNIEDFLPAAYWGFLEQSEFWFYHHSSYPWDTGDVYLEIWNGGATGPQTQVDQTMVTAVHYAPVYATYSFAVPVENNFWALANTGMSAGGWPSILGDGAQGTVYHSFFSDDFVVWEPWDIGGACNYFVAVYWTSNPATFHSLTWGSLKATFQ